MATVNLDKRGFLISVTGAQTPGPSIHFSYDTSNFSGYSSKDRKPVTGIFVGDDSVVTISYSKGMVDGIYPGRAAKKVTVNIG